MNQKKWQVSREQIQRLEHLTTQLVKQNKKGNIYSIPDLHRKWTSKQKARSESIRQNLSAAPYTEKLKL